MRAAALSTYYTETERATQPNAAPLSAPTEKFGRRAEGNAPTVHLHIDSVVLSDDGGAGFARWSAGSRLRLENALNAELTRLLSADSDTARRLAIAGNSAVPLLRAADLLDLTGDNPESCGQNLAAALVAALTDSMPSLRVKGDTP